MVAEINIFGRNGEIAQNDNKNQWFGSDGCTHTIRVGANAAGGGTRQLAQRGISYKVGWKWYC